MTREEASKWLKLAVPVKAVTQEEFNTFTEAVNMAIKALEQEPCEDAISRQAVLNILDDMVKDYIKENDFDKAQGVAWVKVQKLTSVSSSENPNKWIPVSERLPEKYSYTLWCASSGYVRSDYFNGEFWEDAKRYCYEVIAWMPLPEPYNAESEDKE